MLSRHDTARVLFYGTGCLDVYSLYVHMRQAVSHILHHAQLVRQIRCLTASTTESRRCTFLLSCTLFRVSDSPLRHFNGGCSAQSFGSLVWIYYHDFILAGNKMESCLVPTRCGTSAYSFLKSPRTYALFKQRQDFKLSDGC